MKFFITTLLLLHGYAFSQNIPNSYVAFKSTDSIIIDGYALESSWVNAAWSTDFVDIKETNQPAYRTNFKMLWDETNLYLYASLKEPHVWATLKQRDTVIYYNNDFEIFIDPDGDTHDYVEIEVNALNTIWDLFLTKPYRNGGKAINAWDISDLKSEISIIGTLNNSDDTDVEWNVEMALPWSVLIAVSNTKEIPINDYWRINFSRVQWNFDLTNSIYSRRKFKNGNYQPEYNWVWSPQYVVNMHEPERWGYVYFSDAPPGKTEKFELPSDEYLKFSLYANYRKLLNAKGNYRQVANNILNSKEKISGVVPKFEIVNELNEFFIYTVSPFTNKTLKIDFDGKFTAFEKAK